MSKNPLIYKAALRRKKCKEIFCKMWVAYGVLMTPKTNEWQALPTSLAVSDSWEPAWNLHECDAVDERMKKPLSDGGEMDEGGNSGSRCDGISPRLA